MGTRLRKILWFGVSTAIIAGLIYFADVSKFLAALQRANTVILIPAFIAGLAVFPIWSYVWYRVFRRSGIDIGYRKSLRIFMAGNFMNSITPLGQFGGEPIMAYLVNKNSEGSYERAISSVLSSDIINGIPMFTFMLGGSAYLLLFRSLNDVILQFLYIAVLAAVMGGSLIYLLWFEGGRIEAFLLSSFEFFVNLTGRGKGYVELVEEKLNTVEEAFTAMGENPRYLFKTVVVAHLGFIMQIICFYFIAASLGYDLDIAPIYFVVTLAGLANFSPTPGGSGTFEFAMAFLVNNLLPLSFEVGVIIGILFRLTTYWPGILIGYLALNTLERGDR